MWAFVLALIIWIFLGICKVNDSMNDSILKSKTELVFEKNKKDCDDFKEKYAATDEQEIKAALQVWHIDAWEDHFHNYGNVQPAEYCRTRDIIMAIKMKDRIMKEAKLREKDYNPYMVVLGLLAQDGKVPKCVIENSLKCYTGNGKWDAVLRFYKWWSKELKRHGLKDEMIFVNLDDKQSYFDGKSSNTVSINEVPPESSGFITWKGVRCHYLIDLDEKKNTINRAAYYA